MSEEDGSKVGETCLEEMLSCWRVASESSTYALFLMQLEENLGNLLVSVPHCMTLQAITVRYIEIESSRWRDGETERYHAHGIFAAWVAGNIISRFNNQIQTLAGEERVVNFSVIIAALLHDIGGVQSIGRDSASANLALLNDIFSEHNIIGYIREVILEYTRFTDYDNPENPAHFTVRGAIKFDTRLIPLGSLIVIISDLLQIGAKDFLVRIVDDLHFPIDKRPPAYLLLLALSIRELARRLGVEHPTDIIPEEIRKRVIGILTNSDHYNWEDPPYDPATQERFFDNPKSLRDHICGLLGIEVPPEK